MTKMLIDMASISYSLDVFDKLSREKEEEASEEDEASFACYNPQVAAPASAGAPAATDSEKVRIHDLVLMRAKVILSTRSLAGQRVGLGIGGVGGREGSGSGAAVAEEMRAVVKLLRSVGVSGGGSKGANKLFARELVACLETFPAKYASGVLLADALEAAVAGVCGCLCVCVCMSVSVSVSMCVSVYLEVAVAAVCVFLIFKSISLALSLALCLSRSRARARARSLSLVRALSLILSLSL
jgi:hypothetical protein